MEKSLKAVLSAEAWHHHQEKINPLQVHKIKIKKVHIQDCEQLFRFVSRCEDLTELFMLELQDNSNHEHIVHWLSLALRPLRRLRSFDLWVTRVGLGGKSILKSLSGNDDLRVLSLQDSNISGCGDSLVKCVMKFPRLGYLSLNNTGLSRDETQRLLAVLPDCCPHIMGLLLGGLDLTGAGLDQALQKLPELRGLSFRKAIVPMSELINIIANTNENIELLGILHVQDVQKKIDHKLMCDLVARRKNLKYIHMSKQQLSFTGWLKVSSVIEKNGGRLLTEVGHGDPQWNDYFGHYNRIVDQCKYK